MTEAFGLYLVITAPVAGYASCAAAAVAQGVRYVQLRMKAAPRDEVIRVGRELRAITNSTATRFIVNDELEVARAVDADGLHLGQTDMSISEARRRWPKSESKVFGLSTHNEWQAIAAQAQAPDYIGVGPVYPTPTKLIADPVLGIERAAAIIRGSKLSCVAIGGIDRLRVTELCRAGIANYAVVRYVCQHPHPGEAIHQLISVA
jgi:thiamine-phosphate pyrophosphorylase